MWECGGGTEHPTANTQLPIFKARQKDRGHLARTGVKSCEGVEVWVCGDRHGAKDAKYGGVGAEYLKANKQQPTSKVRQKDRGRLARTGVSARVT